MTRDSFPRQYARTQRFTLGVPRGFRIDADGTQILFLRSLHGDDPFTCLWRLDLQTGEETLLVGPDSLPLEDDTIPDAERVRRERARESAGGIVGFDASDDGRTAVFVLGGLLASLDVSTGVASILPSPPGVYDPRLAADGSIAYVCGDDLRVYRDGEDRVLVAGDENARWGTPEFVAAEEMGRSRGHWWSPDSDAVLVTRVDDRPSPECVIASPVEPTREPRAVRYPFAGTDNAAVELHLVGLDGWSTRVDWRSLGHEYLVDVRWVESSEPWCLVQTRDQRSMVLLMIDPRVGTTSPRARWDDSYWVEPVTGSPQIVGDSVVAICDIDGQRVVAIDGAPRTPPDLYVRRLLHADERRIVFEASPDPTVVGIYELVDDEVRGLVVGEGIHQGVCRDGVIVVGSTGLDVRAATHVYVAGVAGDEIRSVAERPSIELNVVLRTVGERDLRVAVVHPHDHDGSPLPVLCDPYGGPHAQRVTHQPAQYYTSQWFADQGFVVVVTDGRGTPGRDARWERAVAGDLAAPVLEDQIDALEAVAADDPTLDIGRVGIRGWSFGGYLAALAVLRRPDVFHCAIAGAPVTDWRLYDTHYTERYLGHPDADGDNYRRTSLIEEAGALDRPLMLIHGLADDNVLVAHTLQLSRALLETGCPHTVLPLSDVTHMTPQEAVAENLLLFQLDFLRRHLTPGSNATDA